MSHGPRPTLHVVIGPAGSGKTWVSQDIARRTGSAYLDKDTMTSEFTERLLEQAGHDPHDRDNNAFYREHILPLEYAALLRAAGDNLRLGTSVVLDAPFGQFLQEPDFLVEAATRHDWPDARWVVVEVVTDGETVRRRIERRGYARDTWKLAHWAKFWSRAGSVDCAWSGVSRIRVDNTGDQPDLGALSPS